MVWIIQALASAAFLGVYDICKKASVQGNAVIPTLFVSVCVSAALWAPWVILSRTQAAEALPAFLFVDALELEDHLRLFAKSSLVGFSWILSYFALKNLPVSMATSIRATSPFWTLAGALALFAERPNGQQWLGIAVTLFAFVALSFAGKKEGLIFHRNAWVGCMIVSTLAGAASSLYDKYLMGDLGYRAATVQAWFSIYLVVVFAPFMLGWLRRWWPRGTFHWRWSIPFIGICLLVADYLYFMALRDEEAMIAIVSCLRRGSVLLTFASGYFLFKERNFRAKTPCVLGILAGIVLIVTA